MIAILLDAIFFCEIITVDNLSNIDIDMAIELENIEMIEINWKYI